jgi:hypothetical protein
MCKRNISRLKVTVMFFIVISFIFLSCKNEIEDNKKLDEIFRLSKIKIPTNSRILKYYDNNEFQVALEIEIPKKELINFVKKSKFIKIQSKEIVLLKTRSDFYIVKEIENAFVPSIKIAIDDQTLVHKDSYSELILDYKKSILYGLISY